jgi:hypothetical protein
LPGEYLKWKRHRWREILSKLLVCDCLILIGHGRKIHIQEKLKTESQNKQGGVLSVFGDCEIGIIRTWGGFVPLSVQLIADMVNEQGLGWKKRTWQEFLRIYLGLEEECGQGVISLSLVKTTLGFFT